MTEEYQRLDFLITPKYKVYDALDKTYGPKQPLVLPGNSLLLGVKKADFFMVIVMYEGIIIIIIGYYK